MTTSPDTPVQKQPTNSQVPSDTQWDDQLLQNPHAVEDKAQRVRDMFAAIARSYDINNRVHSLWRDQAWRRKAVKLCKIKSTDTVLDVACGTGDLSLAYFNAKPGRVIGLDFTHEMTAVAEYKREQAGIHEGLFFGDGDATCLPFPDNSVDVISIAFGIRNVQQPEKAYAEFARVIRPGGRLMTLEFSLPTNPILRAGYQTFFRYVMPHTATWISGDRSGAYKYLPESVNTFMTRQKLIELMSDAGFQEITPHALTFGIAIAYLGHFPE